MDLSQTVSKVVGHLTVLLELVFPTAIMTYPLALRTSRSVMGWPGDGLHLVYQGIDDGGARAKQAAWNARLGLSRCPNGTRVYSPGVSAR
mgnify:CR=1 FL=1